MDEFIGPIKDHVVGVKRVVEDGLERFHFEVFPISNEGDVTEEGAQSFQTKVRISMENENTEYKVVAIDSVSGDSFRQVDLDRETYFFQCAAGFGVGDIRDGAIRATQGLLPNKVFDLEIIGAELRFYNTQVVQNPTKHIK